MWQPANFAGMKSILSTSHTSPRTSIYRFIVSTHFNVFSLRCLFNSACGVGTERSVMKRHALRSLHAFCLEEQDSMIAARHLERALGFISYTPCRGAPWDGLLTVCSLARSLADAVEREAVVFEMHKNCGAHKCMRTGEIFLIEATARPQHGQSPCWLTSMHQQVKRATRFKFFRAGVWRRWKMRRFEVPACLH